MTQVSHHARTGGWIATYTGVQYFPCDPRPEDVCVEDIAHALSNLCRFAGHVRSFYSVAQHSVLVAEQVSADLRLSALMHDAAEAYVVDVPRPLKHAHAMEPYRSFEAANMRVICEALGLPYEEAKEIKTADRRMLITEAEQLLQSGTTAWSASFGGIEPYPIVITPLKPEDAKALFLDTYNDLNRKEQCLQRTAVESVS